MLTPKRNVQFLVTNQTVEEALFIMKNVRYSSVPLLDKDGFYIGTVTEGDLLWFLENKNIEEAKKVMVGSVARNRDYAPVNVLASIEDLITTSLGQNFVPILDDRNFFIGIVTRKDLLSAYIKSEGIKPKHDKLNDVEDAIFKRRSIRKFKDQEIDEAILTSLSKMVVVAPTAKNRRALHTILLTDKEEIRKLSELHYRGGQFRDAPYLLLVYNDNDIENEPKFVLSNASGLVMSVLIALESYDNVGGFWLSVGKKEDTLTVSEYLKVPHNYELIYMVPFGIKDEFKEGHDLTNDPRVHLNKW